MDLLSKGKNLESLEFLFNQIKIKSIKSVSGGSTHRSWHIELISGERFFAKTTGVNLFSSLKFEYKCLNELRKFADSKYLEIPKPFKLDKNKEFSILILPWLPLSFGNQYNLGKGLAILHKNSSNNNLGKFGWEEEGFIGKGKQKHGWESQWGSFFVKYRLIPQISCAIKNKFLDNNAFNYIKNIERFLNNIEVKPSLIHGDLWSGNVGTINKKGAIFDPACYWADKRADISMTKLFGGFTKDFYQGYEYIYPRNIEENNNHIDDIYNLYHVINHANIFGGGYVNQAKLLLKNIHKAIN